MIIDLILDRKDGAPYNPSDFYFDVLQYRTLTPQESDAITRAMDADDEAGTRYALCCYILMNDYNPAICDWVNAQKWL